MREVVRTNNEGGIAILLGLLPGPDAEFRAAAAAALECIQRQSAEYENAIAALLKLLQDESPVVRSSAAAALGTIREQRAVPSLADLLLHDEDWIVRCEAAEAVGYIDPAQAMLALQQAMNDEYEEVRAYAAMAIGRSNEASIVPWLATRLRQEHVLNARLEIYGALARLGQIQYLNRLILALKKADERHAEITLNILDDLGDSPRVVPSSRQCKHLEKSLLETAEKFPLTMKHVQRVLSRLCKGT